jgi:hypothetical protein
MALKGKKKSRARGSQARRRPAAAPRPSYGGRDKPRWYQTTSGLVIAFLVVVTLVITTWWLVANNRNDARALETQKEEIQTFTTDLRSLFQNMTPLMTEMQGAGTMNDIDLFQNTKAWAKQLPEVESASASVAFPNSMASTASLVSQSFILLQESIDLYALIPELEGEARKKAEDSASASFQSSTVSLTVLIGLLDEERDELGLSLSGLTSPGTQPLPEPTPEPTAQPTQGSGSQGGDEGDE